MGGYPWKLEEYTGSPGAGATGSCKPPIIGAEGHTQVGPLKEPGLQSLTRVQWEENGKPKVNIHKENWRIFQKQ